MSNRDLDADVLAAFPAEAGLREALAEDAALLHPNGNAKTVFTFPDGTVGPGRFDPSNGGRIVPETPTPAETGLREALLAIADEIDAEARDWDSGTLEGFAIRLRALSVEEPR